MPAPGERRTVRRRAERIARTLRRQPADCGSDVPSWIGNTSDLFSRSAWHRAQADSVHRLTNVGVLHEPMPNISGGEILRTEQSNAHVYADDVGVNPAGIRIE